MSIPFTIQEFSLEYFKMQDNYRYKNEIFRILEMELEWN